MAIVREEHTSPTGIILMIVNFVFGFIEFFIGLRVLLELLGANRNAGFVQFVYNFSYPFIAPFIGIFPNRVVGDGFYLDAAAILAFIIYGLILILLNSILRRYVYTNEVRRDI